MIADASAVIEALVGNAPSPELLVAMSGTLAAPHLLDTEVMSVLRGLTLAGKLAPDAAEQAWVDYCALSVDRFEFRPLAARAWQLRHQFTSYDAAYLALAEALDEPLGTCDSKLATSGSTATVVLFPRPR